jgi:hypothetical protein
MNIQFIPKMFTMQKMDFAFIEAEIIGFLEFESTTREFPDKVRNTTEKCVIFY